MVVKCCCPQFASLPLRLEEFESQGALMGLIKTSAEGLARLRRELLALSPPTREAVQHLLSKGAPYVDGYKKHIRTAQTLIAAAKPRPKAKGRGRKSDAGGNVD